MKGQSCIYPIHFATNWGRAYDSRKPHTEERKVPTGMHFSSGAGTPVPNQVGLPGATLDPRACAGKFRPWKSIMNPCILTPLHLRHRTVSILQPSEGGLEEVVIVIYFMFLYINNLCQSRINWAVSKVHMAFFLLDKLTYSTKGRRK